MADAAVLDAPAATLEATAPAPAEPAAPVWQPDPRLAPDPEPAAEAAPAAEPAPPATAEPPAPTPAVAEAPAAADSDAAKGAEVPAAPSVPDWKARLDSGDQDLLLELLRHPRLAGHIGTLAERQAAQRLAEQEKAAREAALDRAAEEEPDHPLARERLAAKQEEQRRAQEATLVATAYTTANQGIAEYVQSLPEPIRVELAKIAPEGKTYGDGDFKSGLRGYMGDVVQAALVAQDAEWQAKRLPAELAKAKEAWAKEELPALFKDFLAQKGEKEPSPSLGTNAISDANSADIDAWERYLRMTPEEASRLSSAQVNLLMERRAAALR